MSTIEHSLFDDLFEILLGPTISKMYVFNFSNRHVHYGYSVSYRK